MKIKSIDKFQKKVPILLGKNIFVTFVCIFYSFTLHPDLNRILFTT